MTIRGGGDPRQAWLCTPSQRMGLPPRSYATDAHHCIMVQVRIGPTEYKCVARSAALNGELPSDPTTVTP
jgi:hypothetical protein